MLGGKGGGRGVYRGGHRVYVCVCKYVCHVQWCVHSGKNIG